MSIVVDTPYNSTRGRKPSRPAFLFDFHNDAAGGTAIVDRFGNAANLALQGTLGASWTTSRGWWRPNGTDQHAITGTTNEYASQNVMADALLTPGQALFVAWRNQWPSTKSTSTESVLCVGRNHTTSALCQIGHNPGGSINVLLRGPGASATTTASFGSTSLYTAGPIYSAALHLEATATGVSVMGWLNGVNVGILNELLWAANSGSVPTAAAWAMPNGITIGAQRSGSNPAAPTWQQRCGATNSGGTLLANVLALNMAQANVADAAALALELHQYPRAIGEILAGF